jgi:hypothetical protein
MEKKISGKLLLWTVVWFTVLGLIIAFLGHMEMDPQKGIISKYMSSKDPANAISIEYVYWIVLAMVLAVVGLFQFFSMGRSVRQTIADFETAAKARPAQRQRPAPAPPSEKDKRADALDDQRRAIHLLSLLQREGRLVDFLKEDLKPYDDAQIGAAVRNIQESCQKTLNEYITLKAVLEQEEGNEVTIQPGFDVSAIRLTGNVTGSPPFKGILQHRGWQVTKFSMPSVSATQNPNIVSPAEVEIG